MPYVTTLTEADLEFGKHVAEQLRTKEFPFDGVFWLYDEDADDWQLVIATSLVDRNGRQEAYLRLGQIISNTPRSDFRILNITVMSPQAPLFSALRKKFATSKSVEGVRLQHHVVNGVLIPAAYLYEIH